MPVMVGRKRNQHQMKNGVTAMPMGAPGASLHLSLVEVGTDLGRAFPALLGTHAGPLPEPALAVGEVEEDAIWMIASYQPPPPMAHPSVLVSEAMPSMLRGEMELSTEGDL